MSPSLVTLTGNRERHGAALGVVFEIDVPEVVPSLNILLRRHWMQRRKIAKRWEWIMLASRPNPYVAPSIARVTITRFSRGTLDVDNLYGAAKLVVDALKVVGLIVGDEPKVLELTCGQQREFMPHTEIVIEAVSGC